MDGTCPKGVFASMNGVVSATIIESGKVINVEVMSKYKKKILMIQKSKIIWMVMMANRNYSSILESSVN